MKPLIWFLFFAVGLSACGTEKSDFTFLSDEEYIEAFKVCEIDTDCMMTRSLCFLPESISKAKEYAYIQRGRRYIREEYRFRKKRSPACKMPDYVDITTLRPVCKAKVCSYVQATPLH